VAPYEWYDLPVLIGTIGGIGLIVGPIGLLKSKLNRDLETQDKTRFGMDLAFLVMLFLTSFTGLILMFLRSSPAMGLLLAIHLGVVFSLFITIPYSKFMHGIYRFLALVRYAQERSKL
jgi:citrate/tricarballylate utilization protein